MRRIRLIVMLIIMLISCCCLTGCYDKVPAGHVGVKVYLLGGDKGVDSEELGVGRYWIGINEELYLFPTFTQNYNWTASETEGSEDNESITFQSKNGLSINADVGISYHIEPSKVNMIFQKYRKGVEEITDIFLRNMVRDAFVTVTSKHEAEYIYGKGKSNILVEVTKRVKAQVDPIGIVVEKIYLIGDIRLPEKVRQALDAKVSAKQKAGQRENEVAEAKAEADKKIQEARGKAESILKVAKAQAEANELLAKSITPELIQYEALQKWDGVLPRMTTGAVPFLNVTDLK